MIEDMYTTNAKTTPVETNVYSQKYSSRTIIVNGESYEMPKVNLATSCLICGESVPISHSKDSPKICDKCKKAVMKMRERLLKGKEK